MAFHPILSIIALFLLFSISQTEDIVAFRSLVTIAPKASYIKDLLYILKTIFYNAKYWNFKSFPDPDHNGLSLTNIEVVSIDFKPELVLANPGNTKTPIGFQTTAPYLVYTFHYRWGYEVMGAHLLTGDGSLTMTNAITYCDRTTSNGTLQVFFKAEMQKITGMYNEKLKDWIFQRMNTTTKQDLLDAISYNTKFIAGYMFKTYEVAERRINDKVLQYYNFPEGIGRFEDKVAVVFESYIYYNQLQQCKIYSNDLLQIKGDKRIAVYLNPLFIPYAFNSTAYLGNLFGAFNFSSIGMKGVLGEFSQAVPEFVMRFGGDKPVKLFCDYSRNLKEFHAFEKGLMQFQLTCDFSIGAGKTFLASTVSFKMKYSAGMSKDDNKVLVGEFSNVEVIKVSARPFNSDIAIFLIDFFQQYGVSVMNNTENIQVPRLRFEPLRDFGNMTVEVTPDYYVAYYEDSLPI